jgi:hypothetical protein
MSELDIFAAALEITDGAQRSAYLDQACGNDLSLRKRIELLLRNQQEAGSFLENPPAVVPDAENGAT